MALHPSLDVSDLAAPEPLEKVMASLGSLESGSYLHVVHRRVPDCLFRLLEEAGFRHSWRSGHDARVQVWIWRADDDEAREAAEQAARV